MPNSISDSIRAWFQKAIAFLRQLDILGSIARLIKGIILFINRNTNFIFWFVLAFVLISFIGIYWEICWLICFAGLLWVFVLFLIFMFSIKVRTGFKEAMNWVDKKKDTLNYEETQTETILNSVIFHAPAFLFYFLATMFIIAANKLTYTVAGIAIALTHLAAKFHINYAIASHEITITDAIFTVGMIAYGVISDLSELNSVEKKGGRGLVYFAYIQLYIVILMLTTGLLGGTEAITGIHKLVGKPWLYFTEDIFNYSSSAPYAIFRGLGIVLFVFLYLAVPATIALSAKGDLMKLAKGETTEFPKFALKSMLYTSFLFLAIFLLVGWYEGWIAMFIYFIIWLIYLIYKLISGLFD